MEKSEIFKTLGELPLGIVENNIIEKVNVNIIAHYGNLTSFEIRCKNITPYSGINNTKNLGYVIKTFTELMGLSREDGIRLDEIKDVPCRLLFDSIITSRGAKVVAIGNFMDNRFIQIKDLARVGISDFRV